MELPVPKLESKLLIAKQEKESRLYSTVLYSMRHLTGVLPDSPYFSLPGQTHLVNPKILASELIKKFRS